MSNAVERFEADRIFVITVYGNRTRPQGRALTLTWENLAAMLERRLIRPGKDGPLWSPVRLDPTNRRRANENVAGISAVVADIDDYSHPDAVLGGLQAAGLEFVAYTTHSHHPERPKYRVALPLGHEVTPEEWPAVWRGFVAAFGGGHIDPQCCDVSRAYYLPSAPNPHLRDWEPWVRRHHGRALDPAELIAAAPPAPPAALRTAPREFPRNGHRPAADIILARSLQSTEGKARHYAGYHLARQLQANGYSLAEAEPVILALQAQLERAGDHAYTEREALASMAKAYSEPALAPWPDRELRRVCQPAGVPLPALVRPLGIPLPPPTRPVGVPLYGTETHR